MLFFPSVKLSTIQLCPLFFSQRGDIVREKKQIPRNEKAEIIKHCGQLSRYGIFERGATNDKRPIATCDSPEKAAEVLRCWNNHDALLGALERLISYHYHNDNGVKPKEYHDAIKAIGKASHE